MRPHPQAVVLVLGSVIGATCLEAQSAAGRSLDEAGLYSLYVKRHAATMAFADLGATRATDGKVRKTAEDLGRAHREAREKLERIAGERHVTLAPPERDTSAMLLEQARASLEGKTGRTLVQVAGLDAES